jgi:3-dehydroquinate dehydratase II
MKINIINGPNLNLLGLREPHVYGSLSFEMYLDRVLKAKFPDIELNYFQSNGEGFIIDHIHSLIGQCDGIVINAGGYSHTSIAIADAISAVKIPTVEVHISNIFSRETFRHHSFIAPKCIGTISGLGLEGYQYAIEFLNINEN